MAQLDDIAIEKFREYLRIDTTSDHADYYAVGDFLKKYAAELGGKFVQFDLMEGRPVYVITFEGRDEAARARKSVVLNSHMDVVPAYPESWTHPPFSADMTPDGRIFARGTQDMKCVGIWYLEAIRRLQAENGGKAAFSRTVHCLFVPDEERGGEQGMKLFIKSPEFASLNAGIALDEGMANANPESNAVIIYHSERYPFWTEVSLEGTTGHGSQTLPNTVGEKLTRFLDTVYAYREQQRCRVGTQELDVETGLPTRVGESDVTSVNLTMINSGVASNVVPSRLVLTVDVRMPPHVPEAEARALVDSWCAKAAEDGSAKVEWTFPVGRIEAEFARIRRSSAYSTAVEHACEAVGYAFEWQTFPGSTDMRFLRANGVRAINVSPICGVPRLLHCHDEYITRDVFLRGVKFYVKLIPDFADIAED